MVSRSAVPFPSLPNEQGPRGNEYCDDVYSGAFERLRIALRPLPF